MKTNLVAIIVMLVLLAACSASPTRPLIPTPTQTATAIFLATPTPAATATSALEISDTAFAYLKAAFEIMQNNGINRKHVDWITVRTKAFMQAQHAQTPAETYAAIRYVLQEAGGRHSFFLTPDMTAQGQEATMDDSPAPRGKLLLEKLGYIAIEGFGSTVLEEGEKYATRVQQIIGDLDAQEPCGWLVDLRENTGGNMWPMLAGLGPILGEGKAGSFVDPDGDSVDWSYREGQALLGDFVMTQVPMPPYQLKAGAPPVAVLTGVNTASSGEVIVVSFRERPDTRSFGLYTAGLSTSNQGFPLSDGALIILTTGVYADRTGKTYGDRIFPDEVVDEAREFSMIMDEAIPQPAVDWLMNQPACIAQ